jgi:ABC-type Mn2+/Zn2+ transport system ATPase subunit
VFIETIELASYRSCKSTKLTPDPMLSALIGVNGSGKSNILQGILLLRKIARVTRAHHDPEDQLSGCKVRVTFNVDNRPIRYEALVKYTTNDRNLDEVVSATQRWNLKEFTGSGIWLNLPMSLPIEQLRFFGRLSPRESRIAAARYVYFSGEQFKAPKKLERIFRLIQRVAEFVMGITYYSASRFTDPSKCPASFEIESGRPRPGARFHGEHSRFMLDLYGAFQAKEAEFQEFTSIVGADGIGLIDSIEYDVIDVPSSVYQVITGGRVIRKEVKKVLVIPNFVVKGTKLSPNQLSEGTFKTLAVVFYLITDRSRLLLLEEPEVCVHHGLLSSILDIIKAFSRRKQIVISTHSDFVLDALAPDNVFVVRRSASKGTTVARVSEKMTVRQYQSLKKYLMESGNLGEYWRHGDLEA